MKLPEIKAIFTFAHGIVPKAVVDRDDKIVFNFKKTKTPEGNIDAYGITTSITGKHYDKIICDDFITLEDRTSKAEREKTKNVIREIQTNIIDPGKQVGFIGTPWHKNDAWKIVPEPEKYSVYDLDILSEEEIIKKRQSTTGSLYAANYELKHIIAEDALFKEANYSRWEYNIKTGVFGHLDAKFKGDHTNGLTFMHRKKDGRIQGVGFCFHNHINDKLQFVKEMWKKYYCGSLFVEENPDKGFVAEELRKLGITVTSYHEKMNKHVKIEKYLYKEWKNIDWANETDPEYINQILDYIEGQEPDDCPDSAASLIRAKFYKADDSLYNW